MNYRIETKEAFRIVGKSYPLSREIEQNFFGSAANVAGSSFGRHD